MTARAIFKRGELAGQPLFEIRNQYLPQFRFEARGIDQAAPEGTLAIFYRRNPNETYDRCGSAEYRGGKWLNPKGKELTANDLVWAVAVDDRA